VISLLIAAHAPDRVKAVVSYYPVTDFPRWLAKPRSGIGERIAYRVVRWYFHRQSGATIAIGSPSTSASPTRAR
jgi:hypothetical protein